MPVNPKPSPSNKYPHKLTATLALLFAAAMFIAAFKPIIERHVNGYIKTNGIVIDVITKRSYDGFDDTPIVQYEVDGVSYIIKGKYSGVQYKNSSRTVYYNPANPSIAEVYSPMEFLVFFSMGIMFSAVAFKSIRNSIKCRKKPDTHNIP